MLQLCPLSKTAQPWPSPSDLIGSIGCNNRRPSRSENIMIATKVGVGTEAVTPSRRVNGAAAHIVSLQPQEVFYKTVEIDGLQVAYREAGNPGSPKLVLLHGFGDASLLRRQGSQPGYRPPLCCSRLARHEPQRCIAAGVPPRQVRAFMKAGLGMHVSDIWRYPVTSLCGERVGDIDDCEQD